METTATTGQADKSKELSATIALINDRLHFNGSVEGNMPVSIDYTPPLGDNLGYTSLELLLLSLSSCIGSAVLTFLRRMKKNISAFEIRSRGTRRQEHPLSFDKIYLDIDITSPDVTSEDVSKVLKLSEETYCPVWAMLKGNVSIETSHTIRQ